MVAGVDPSAGSTPATSPGVGTARGRVTSKPVETG